MEYKYIYVEICASVYFCLYAYVNVCLHCFESRKYNLIAPNSPNDKNLSPRILVAIA